MTYLPLLGIVALAAAVWAVGRRPLRRPVEALQFFHLRAAFSFVSVVFVVWGGVSTVENLVRQAQDRQLLSGGARATAEVFKPSGFMGIGEAVDRDGPCDRGRVVFEDDRGVRRFGYVETEGHDLREGTRVVVAYDLDEPEGYQPMTAVSDRCTSRTGQSLATSFAMLLVGGQAIVLRRYALTEPRHTD